jgi:hypothetical protein
LRLRLADVDVAGQIALLHADSWRRHHRGAYADSFLDGDVEADRVVRDLDTETRTATSAR